MGIAVTFGVYHRTPKTFSRKAKKEIDRMPVKIQGDEVGGIVLAETINQDRTVFLNKFTLSASNRYKHEYAQERSGTGP